MYVVRIYTTTVHLDNWWLTDLNWLEWNLTWFDLNQKQNWMICVDDDDDLCYVCVCVWYVWYEWDDLPNSNNNNNKIKPTDRFIYSFFFFVYLFFFFKTIYLGDRRMNGECACQIVIVVVIMIIVVCWWTLVNWYLSFSPLLLLFKKK